MGASSEDSHYRDAGEMQQVAPFRNSIYSANPPYDPSGGASVNGSAYGGLQQEPSPVPQQPARADERLDPGAIRAVALCPLPMLRLFAVTT